MKAMVVENFADQGAMRLHHLPDPVCGDDDILLDVHATAVNYVDLLVTSGTYQFKPKLPFIPGKLTTGVVSAVGRHVTSLRIGDRIQTLLESGGYADCAVAPAHECYILPDRLSFNEAAAMALGFDTAWFALHARGRLKRGEHVLILGASGAVGGAAVQLAKAHGAHVIAGITDMSKAEEIRSLGADLVVDLSMADVRDTLRASIINSNNGKLADVIVDMLGGDYFNAAIRCTAWCGRYVIVGFASGNIPTLKMNYVLLKNIEVSGLQVSDYRKWNKELMAQCYHDIFQLVDRQLLKAPDYVCMRLEDANDALALIKNRKAKHRLILTPQL
jgi:NADPH2:quinone reductase